MRIDGTIRYAQAGLDEVFAMLIDQRFQERKCAASGALSYEVSISPDASAPAAVTVTTRRVLPADGLPDFAKALVRDGLRLTETIRWQPPAADGSRTASVELAFVGQPMKMTGRLHMAAAGPDVTCVLAAELTASVPMLGGRIEKATAAIILKALQSEQDLGRSWLAEARA